MIAGNHTHPLRVIHHQAEEEQQRFVIVNPAINEIAEEEEVRRCFRRGSRFRERDDVREGEQSACRSPITQSAGGMALSVFTTAICGEAVSRQSSKSSDGGCDSTQAHTSATVAPAARASALAKLTVVNGSANFATTRSGLKGGSSRSDGGCRTNSG